jgi:hypothetical protein
VENPAECPYPAITFAGASLLNNKNTEKLTNTCTIFYRVATKKSFMAIFAKKNFFTKILIPR